MFALVNPWGTGTDVSNSFRLYGDSPLHIWETCHEDKYWADAYPKKLLVSGADDPRLKDLNLDGFIPGHEIAVELSEQLSERYGHSANVSALRSARVSKLMMQTQLATSGIPHVQSDLVRSLAEARTVTAKVERFPVVVKPTRGAGAADVEICDTPADALRACGAILDSESPLGFQTDVVVQEFVEGTQYFVNTVSIGGVHVLVDVWELYIDESGAVPLCKSASLVRNMTPDLTELVEYTKRCLDALGVREGAVHSEVRLTAGGPRLIEINCRVMGGSLDPLPYRLATGHSHADLLAERSISPELFRTRIARPYQTLASVVIIFLYAPKSGIVRSINMSVLENLQSFRSVRRLPKVGDQVWAGEAAGGVANLGGSIVLGHENFDVTERDRRTILDSDVVASTLLQIC